MRYSSIVASICAAFLVISVCYGKQEFLNRVVQQCPLCGCSTHKCAPVTYSTLTSISTINKTVSEKYNIHTCRRCGLNYLSPALGPHGSERLEESNNYYWNDKIDVVESVRVQKDFDQTFVNQIEFLKLEKILSDGTVSVQSSYESFLAKA